jgi:pantoate--beta-alanine ligase
MAEHDSTNPKLVHTIAEVRRAVSAVRQAGQGIAVVPTMGALHEGHLSLVRAAAAECSFVIVTIFVNPTQFGPAEDFSKYPRTLPEDVAALATVAVDLVFAPSVEEMYPAGCTTSVEPPAVAAPLEGRCRPGHFRGVATVVLKLFNIVQADVAYFGRKDYQQALVIQRMVRDLDVPIAIRMGATVREPDGLALSSRNRYLNADQRVAATALSRALTLAAEQVASGARDGAVISAAMRAVLVQAGLERIDYATVADPLTLQPVQEIHGDVVALIAAYTGTTRLIDNRHIEFPA